MVLLWLWNASHRHVSVSNGLHLEQTVLSNKGIKTRVHIIQHRHDLLWRHGLADVGEANNVREKDSDRIIRLWLNLAAFTECLDNLCWQDILQQCLLLLAHGVGCADQVLLLNDFKNSLLNLFNVGATHRVLVPAFGHQVKELQWNFEI